MLVDRNGLWPEWASKALAIAAIGTIAVVSVVAVVATAGAASVAVGAAATTYGTAAFGATAGATIGTVATYATTATAATTAAFITVSASSDMAEVVTGENYMCDTLFRGNRADYEFYKGLSYVAASGITEVGLNSQKVVDTADEGSIDTSSLEPTHSLTLGKNHMKKLMDDIAVNGIKDPIKYVEYNGHKYVVDGHHRLYAAKQLQLYRVPAQRVDLPYAGYKTIDDLLWFD